MNKINEEESVPASAPPASTSADIATYPTMVGAKKKKSKKNNKVKTNKTNKTNKVNKDLNTNLNTNLNTPIKTELDESVGNMVGTFYIYKIIKQLLLPYDKWTAFKDKAIDKDGNVLDKTKLSFYDKVLLSIKKILSKFINKKTITIALILKYITENVEDKVQDKEKIEYLLEIISNKYFSDVEDEEITEIDIRSNYNLIEKELF